MLFELSKGLFGFGSTLTVGAFVASGASYALTDSVPGWLNDYANWLLSVAALQFALGGATALVAFVWWACRRCRA